MSDERRLALTFPLTATVLLAATSFTARADVTIQELSTLDFGFFKQHATSTEYLTSDKRRHDTEAQCEGFMALFCKDAQNGDIVRLDRDLSWTLYPKDKQYKETPFPTAAQRQAAEQQALANMEKLKQCPATPQQAKPAGPDTSKCQMSPPKFDVKQLGTHATIAGHDTQLTEISLTQSCTDQSTGDTCDMLFLFDSWLTQDTLPGADDRKAFAEAYARKTGLTAADAALVQQRMKQFLAGYSGSLKDLQSKVGELKGSPLKTSLRMAFGGEHCSAAKNAAAQGNGAGGTNAVTDASKAAGDAATSSASGAAGSAAGNAAAQAAGNGAAGSVLGSAASAFGSKLVSGLFAKKNSNTTTPAAPTPATTPNPLPPNMIQTTEISTETTSITTGAVPASQFDIPAGWTQIQQKAKDDKAFSCPKAGG
jgi:hypothetical protein